LVVLPRTKQSNKLQLKYLARMSLLHLPANMLQMVLRDKRHGLFQGLQIRQIGTKVNLKKSL
jgi:hypothetical protein